MKQSLFCYLGCILCFVFTSCNGQKSGNPSLPGNKIIGGGCDGCELMYIDMPKDPDHIDTSAGWGETGQKLFVTGKVYHLDGKTPAPNVVIYYWQTDSKGYYSPAKGLNQQAIRHGHIRGWVKTGKDGSYSIYTIRPAPYPKRDIPAHIHLSVKEPDIKTEYYTDELVFDDDVLLTGVKRRALENRGGSGILRLLVSGDMFIAEHNIVLGLNIPNYPNQQSSVVKSGLSIGEDNPSFTPYHAFGPDKGTRTCPVCKYGRFHGIIYFVGNHPDWSEIQKWLLFLEKESVARSRYLKAYFVYGNEKNYSKPRIEKELDSLGKTLGLNNVALTFVPSMNDSESEVYLNKINPEVENTFVIFKHSNIMAKFVNLRATAGNFTAISAILNATKGDYFSLPTISHE